MRVSKLVSAVGLLLLSAGSVAAQEQQSMILALEFQTPKNGMTKQYEDGRKQKAAWHKQQNDKSALLVWSIRSGEHTGSYVVGQVVQHWADFDKPSVPEAADLEEYSKVIEPYVQSLTTEYYESLPKLSKPANETTPPKFSEVIAFKVRPGHSDDFHSAVDRVNEGAKKTNWPVNYEWYVLTNGGPAGLYVLVIPHPNWADFDDKPGMKTFRQMLNEAFGEQEAESIVRRLDSSIELETSEISEFRPDLSYLPSK